MAALLGLAAPTAAAVTCNVATVGVAFGSYDPLTPLSTDSTGSVTVECGPSNVLETLVAFSASYTIALSPGAAGSYLPRTMFNGPAALAYNLYRDSTRLMLWGDGSGGSLTLADILTSGLLPLGASVERSYSIYGRIAPQQNVSGGAYTDSITVTLSF